MNFKTKLFLILFSSSYISLSAHKLIILVSTPRSLSTVFLRMMENRGDFTIFNEPGIATFLTRRNNHLSIEFTTSTTYENVLEILGKAHHAQNVFIKEMFFAAEEYLFSDYFTQNPDCYFVFLVRNPHSTSLSNFNKLYSYCGSYEKIWDIKENVPNHITYSALYGCYKNIAQKSMNKPYVVISEDLIENPEKIFADFCKYVDIPMKKEYLTWKPYEQTFDSKTSWNDSKSFETAHFWHDAALASTHITQPSIYHVDEKGKPTFQEIKDEQLRGAYKWEYYDNMIYYNLFTKLAEAQN